MLETGKRPDKITRLRLEKTLRTIAAGLGDGMAPVPIAFGLDEYAVIGPEQAGSSMGLWVVIINIAIAKKPEYTAIAKRYGITAIGSDHAFLPFEKVGDGTVGICFLGKDVAGKQCKKAIADYFLHGITG